MTAALYILVGIVIGIFGVYLWTRDPRAEEHAFQKASMKTLNRDDDGWDSDEDLFFPPDPKDKK